MASCKRENDASLCKQNVDVKNRTPSLSVRVTVWLKYITERGKKMLQVNESLAKTYTQYWPFIKLLSKV